MAKSRSLAFLCMTAVLIAHCVNGMPQDGTDTSSSAPSSDATTPTTPTTDTTTTPTADTTTTTTEAPKTWPVDLVNFPAQGIYDCVFLFYVCTDKASGGWPADKEKCSALYKECTVKLGLDPTFYAGPPRLEDRQFYFPIVPVLHPVFPLAPIQPYYLKK